MLADQYDALAQMNGHSVYIFNREGTILSSSDKAAYPQRISDARDGESACIP